MSEIASARHNGYVDFEPYILDRSRVNEALVQVADNLVSIGSANRSFTERELDSSGIAYVDMNNNGFVKVAPEKDGVVATSSLNGCTGVAAFAKMPDGETRAMVNHYDPISQVYAFTKKDSPINDLLYTFRHEAGKTIPMQVVVTYPEAVQHEANFGSMQGAFDEWHYMDQLFTTARYLGENVQVLFIPYRKSETDRSVYLAAGSCEGTSGIFYNGELVDFDRRFSSGFNHSQWREPTTPSYEHSNMETIRTREALLNNWAYLASGQGAVITDSIQSEVVDEELFSQLMDGKVDSEEQAEALSELATVKYAVRTTRNEYTATLDGKQYRVSVENKSGSRLDSIDVMPGGVVIPELGFMMHTVTVAYNDPNLKKTHATTYYCIDDLIKKNSRLHRVDYTYNNHSQELPDGESSAYVPSLSDVIKYSHNMMAFSEPPHIASDDRCTVKTSGIRFSDAANLKAMIPHLEYAS